MRLELPQYKERKWKRGQYLMILTILMNLITVWTYIALPRKSGRLVRLDLNSPNVPSVVEQPQIRFQLANDHKTIISGAITSRSVSKTRADTSENLDLDVQGTNKSITKEIADKQQLTLLDEIDSGRGPVIVGGIGDSGTRGVHDVLVNFGVRMPEGRATTRDSSDSLIYSRTYSAVTTQSRARGEEEVVWINHKIVYEATFIHSHKVNYDEESIGSEAWHTVRQWASKMLRRTLYAARLSHERDIDPWGFKHPRTSLLLPIWTVTLGSKFLFVHVIRDGKDIAMGDNQDFHNKFCPSYYQRNCSADSLAQKVQFWADLNMDIFNYVLSNPVMKSHQYIVLRSEDLVMGNRPCYVRLAKYLGIPEQELDKLVSAVIESNRGHERSYLGNKYTEAIKERIVSQLKDIPEDNFSFWGYQRDSFALSKDCESLDWMYLMRKAKGPLPGDQ